MESRNRKNGEIQGSLEGMEALLFRLAGSRTEEFAKTVLAVRLAVLKVFFLFF